MNQSEPSLGLLVLPSGRDALTCCRRDFRNGSTSCELSDAPDPTCEAHWSADNIMVVDETGATDPTRVHHAGPQTLVLKGKHTDVILRMDCKPPKKSLKVSCNGPFECVCGEESDSASWRPKPEINHRLII
ncbi:hypothetical protein DPX16_1133 [Anabarilius grahami]|uniref:Uncharacterized protein n=1 Tax=Anabarilius grahami TaxID=495550 RepID=A0A3N0Y089_ANAGA|nr:hypothetical protein DPX16_1133 [Anabarilius grahami]